MIIPSGRLSRLQQVGTVLSLVAAPDGAQRALAQAPVPRAAPPPDALERMNESIGALTRKVWPSVVQIVVTSLGGSDDDRRGDIGSVGRQRSVGSGFCSFLTATS